MSNIVEGFERASSREFRQFLYVAKASAAEVRSLLYVARDLHYIDDGAHDLLQQQVVKVSSQLAGLKCNQ
jgi:four helix bundle protein